MVKGCLMGSKTFVNKFALTKYTTTLSNIYIISYIKKKHFSTSNYLQFKTRAAHAIPEAEANAPECQISPEANSERVWAGAN